MFFCSEDGIVIAISVWQCLLEFFTNFLTPILFFFMGQMTGVIYASQITLFLNYVIFPSFYLFADARFRRTLTQKGTFQAIWLAMKQTYSQGNGENIEMG